MRPAIRVDQLGYLAAGPKLAVWVTDATEPAPFSVRGAIGEARLSVPCGEEPTSGLRVHVLDFGDAPAAEGVWLEAGEDRSHPFAIRDDLYRGLAVDALRFFGLQRSGIAIEDDVYGRPAGHPGDASVPALSHPGRFDVSGGWYDAGDHGKYVTSGAMPVWQLLATAELVRRRGGDDRALLDECRWQLDWLLRMQVPEGLPHAGLAFHRVHGTEWAPLPCAPHDDPTTRVLHPPSTSAGLHLAAAAAHGSRVFAGAYARRLRDAAVRAFAAAEREPERLAPDDHGAHGGGPYAWADLSGDWTWAAAELWLATGDEAYGRALPADPFPLDGFDCHDMAAAGVLDLAWHGDAAARDAVGDAADRLRALAGPWGQPYAPESGWDWGSNGRILNNLVVLAAAHELTGRPELLAAATRGMDYLLGCNALGQSYVTGYGTDFSRHQRVRHWAHDLDPALPPPPPGALAGGPTSKEHPGFPPDPRLAGLPPQQRYLDEVTSETTNDVCIRWNAPLVFMATYLTP